FVSHNLAAVKRFCDRVVLLDHGQVRCDTTPDEAIAEYSRLVSDLEDANPQGLEGTHIGGRSCGGGRAARIEAVRILDAADRPSRRFVSGEPVSIEVDYAVEPGVRLASPLNLVISVHMFGAGLFYQFESLRDG